VLGFTFSQRALQQLNGEIKGQSRNRGSIDERQLITHTETLVVSFGAYPRNLYLLHPLGLLDANRYSLTLRFDGAVA
jgi:hypothetical protein